MKMTKIQRLMVGSLHISEKFRSIQGEGQTMGVPAIFVRLSGCNLLCKSRDWVCDSIKVWQKGVKTNFEQVLSKDWVDSLRNGTHLVFTGGEPMLHQKNIEKYLRWFFGKYNFMPTIEVETNGTKTPNSYLLEFVDYWNCSPKLENSGETFGRRIVSDSLKAINNSKGKKIFKFVISSESDMQEIERDFSSLIDSKNIVLMPAGENQEELDITRPIVAQYCADNGVRYSERLHIVIWNKKTGV